MLLEKLSAKERAAYLLHDIFDLDYSEISSILEEKTDYCRQLVTRARHHIKQPSVQSLTLPTQQQVKTLDNFKKAVQSNDIELLTQLLTTDIQLAADGGGKVSAIPQPFTGQPRVLRFFERLLLNAWNMLTWKMCHLNGNISFKLSDQHDHCTTLLTFNFSQNGQIQNIYVLRNPDKLKHLTEYM